MSSDRHSFKYNDARRLARAAKAEGFNVKGFELDCGKVTVLVGDDAPKPLDPPNPWEQDDNA